MTVNRLLSSSVVTIASALLRHDRRLDLGRARSSAGRRQRRRAGSDDLLRAAPFDRITLIDGTVLIVDPVSPRPLPATIRPRTKMEEGRRDRKSS